MATDAIPFSKYSALGNAYLVRVCGTPEERLSSSSVIRLCDYRQGIGADGILELEKQGGSYRLSILNPDGSEAEKSGNGIRIAAAYLFARGFAVAQKFPLQTKGGIVSCHVSDNGRNVSVDMGIASFSSRSIPVAVARAEVIDYPVSVAGKDLKINAVSIGNPHCVVLCDTIDENVAKALGPLIERHPLFPNRTNVQFAKVLDRRTIRIEIWERGAGYTLSSGTSSCAAAAIARRKGLVDAEVVVQMPGGNLFVTIDDDYRVVLEGPVTEIADISVHPGIFD